MKTLKTDIIPTSQSFVCMDEPAEIDFRAVCSFVATGFFLDDDTYWKHKKVLRPSAHHTIDSNENLIKSEYYFKWHYSPRSISFEQALDEFETLFDAIIHEQTVGKSVILPLSGGLDSRTQAVALKKHPNITSYSYRFTSGYPEDKIGKKIAQTMDFDFTSLKVQSGYLWDSIEDLAAINHCYSDFTHSRQMAFVDKYADMGEVFSLGHWGDVLFDGLGDIQWSTEEQLNWIKKKIIKKGGLELANSLWKSWGLDGDFTTYFNSRILHLLKGIDIENTSAKIRAFKSMFWAPRWTSVNLGVFGSVASISLPYYDNRMCEFICTIPEEFLADRKLQIAYIKRKSKNVARITWHEQKPFNLQNYRFNKAPYNFPYRVFSKVSRTFNKLIGRPHIARNWELQFVGKENDEHLKQWLFESGLDDMISSKVIQEFYSNFKTNDAVKYSHPVSMLLTLAVFNKKFR